MWRALNDSLKKVKKTAAYDSDDEPPAEAKPKTKVASKKQKKAEAKAAAKAASAQKEATAQKAHQFYRDFVTHHAHGQAPLVSSWEPQQAAASSSWQAPMPSPPPASSSRTPPAPPAPPSRSSSSWEIWSGSDELQVSQTSKTDMVSCNTLQATKGLQNAFKGV
jgi:hypothetical protein